MSVKRLGFGWGKWVDAEEMKKGCSWGDVLHDELPVQNEFGEIWLVAEGRFPFVVIVKNKCGAQYRATRVPCVLIVDNFIEGARLPLQEVR